MADSIAGPKLLGDYLEELVNGWCHHDKTDDNHQVVQALRCPECIGDALAEVQKQARAEVLAACKAKVNIRIHNAQCSELPGDIQDVGLLSLVRQDLEQLQPAASNLEALLREEWNKAIDAVADRCREHGKYQGERLSSGSDTGRTTIPFWLLGAEEDAIDSLRKEKARAEGKG